MAPSETHPTEVYVARDGLQVAVTSNAGWVEVRPVSPTLPGRWFHRPSRSRGTELYFLRRSTQSPQPQRFEGNPGVDLGANYMSKYQLS